MTWSRPLHSLAFDMRENEYDAIVVRARCAGSPTAMLLARNGYKEWGLLDRLVATGCPPIDTYEGYFRPDRGFAAWRTNDDLTVVIGGWPRSELARTAGSSPEAGRRSASRAFRPDMDEFARVAGAVTSPPDFLSEQNVGRLLAAAGKPSGAAG
jgi:hypothetical protein